MKKLIITETQYKTLKNLLSEGDYHIVLNKVVEDLNKNYKKVTAVVNNNRDYVEESRFEVKADESVISAKGLLEYFKFKYHESCGEEFLKQVIDDWYHDRIKDGLLSKNITLK